MNLYLRLLKLLFMLPFVPPQDLLLAGRIRFRVWPSDCDINMHLNNGRYLTFMDLGRVHLMAQVGLLGELWRRRWSPVISAAEINFIRPIGPLQKFELMTRLLTWDEKYFYIEQRFVSAGRLCAVALVKGLFLQRGKRVETAQLLTALGIDPAAPEMPPLVRHWNELAVLKKQYSTEDGGA